MSTDAQDTLRAEIERLQRDGPMMQRGEHPDGSPWMGTMRECLEDYKTAAEVEARHADELRAELTSEKDETFRLQCSHSALYNKTMHDTALLRQALDFLVALEANHWGDRQALVTALRERLNEKT